MKKKKNYFTTSQAQGYVLKRLFCQSKSPKPKVIQFDTINEEEAKQKILTFKKPKPENELSMINHLSNKFNNYIIVCLSNSICQKII